MSNKNIPSNGVLTEPGTAAANDRKQAKGRERRKNPRHPVSASVEVVELATRTKLTGRATDLSAGGCYVDVISPLAVSSTVRLRLAGEGHSLITPAVVTYSLTGMGMGLMFVNISADQEAILRKWLAELTSGPAAPEAPEEDGSIVFEESRADLSASKGLRAATLELVELLKRKEVLSEFEAGPLLKKISG